MNRAKIEPQYLVFERAVDKFPKTEILMLYHKS